MDYVLDIYGKYKLFNLTIYAKSDIIIKRKAIVNSVFSLVYGIKYYITDAMYSITLISNTFITSNTKWKKIKHIDDNGF